MFEVLTIGLVNRRKRFGCGKNSNTRGFAHVSHRFDVRSRSERTFLKCWMTSVDHESAETVGLLKQTHTERVLISNTLGAWRLQLCPSHVTVVVIYHRLMFLLGVSCFRRHCSHQLLLSCGSCSCEAVCVCRYAWIVHQAEAARVAKETSMAGAEVSNEWLFATKAPLVCCRSTSLGTRPLMYTGGLGFFTGAHTLETILLVLETPAWRFPRLPPPTWCSLARTEAHRQRCVLVVLCCAPSCGDPR